MDTENNVVVDENKEPVIENQTEVKAREQGWRPKEEFEGEPDKWVSAETFLAKGELIERIEALGKELKTTKKAMHMLEDHHKKVKEVEFKRALDFLKQQKREAYQRGDVDQLIELDEKIAETKETQKQSITQEVAQEEVPYEFAIWQKANPWYTTDIELKEIADNLGISYAKRTGKEPEEVLDYVEKQIKKMYPDKFSNPKREQPNAVEGTGNKGVTRISDNFEMSEEEKKVMNTFVRTGIMSKEDYIRDLKAMRGQ